MRVKIITHVDVDLDEYGAVDFDDLEPYLKDQIQEILHDVSGLDIKHISLLEGRQQQ